MNNRELRRRLEAAGFTLEHGGSHIKVKQGKQLITTISMGAHSVGGTKKGGTSLLTFAAGLV